MRPFEATNSLCNAWEIMAPRQRVAIVGIGGIFPQSATLEQFWSNIQAGIDTAREVPAGRWILANEDVFDPNVGAPDRVYSLRGCFIEGFQFDPEGLQLDSSLLQQLDPMYHLALHAGRQAWRDAFTRDLDLTRVGVVLGNIALPTDSVSAITREILRQTLPDLPSPPGKGRKEGTALLGFASNPELCRRILTTVLPSPPAPEGRNLASSPAASPQACLRKRWPRR